VFTVTGLASPTAYAFKLTSTDYQDYTVPGGYTATPNGSFTPAAITLTPKPATATITASVAGGGTIAGLTMTANPSSGVSVSTTGNVVTATGLTPGTDYDLTVTSTNYEDYPLTYTNPAINGTFTQSITLVPKKATATITASVAGGGTIAGLTVVGPITGATISTVGNVITITGLTSGTAYNFTVRSDDYLDQSVAYTATPNGAFTTSITLPPKPATATITIAGGAAAVGNLAVTSNPAVTPTRVGSVFTFTLPSGAPYTFTVTATGYQTATTTYTATPNGTFSETITPTAN
jgi:hypothetical protein